MTVLAVIGAILLLLLGLALPPIFPSLIVVAVAALVAFRTSKRVEIRVLVLVGLSALITLGPRIPSLLAGDPDETRTNIEARTMIGPQDKLRLEADAEYVYFRRNSDPPAFGIRNDWSFGIRPLATVYEKPDTILTELGIAHTKSGNGAVTLRIATPVRNGVMEVNAQVIVAGKPVATYLHKVRKSYPFEEFNYYGSFGEGDWRPVFLYLTGDTWWALRTERFAAGYHPLRSFIEAAIGQGAVSETGEAVTPHADPLQSPEKLRMASARFQLDKLVDGQDIAPNRPLCEGEDAGHAFTAIAPEVVQWKDDEIPRLHLPRSVVDGYHALPNTMLCDGARNRFWVAAFHVGRINLWQYRVDFNARSLRLEQWLQAEPSPEAAKVFEGMRNKMLWLTAIHDGSVELYMVNWKKDRRDKVVAENGYRIDVDVK
jgi:hypothetical protein